MLEEVDPISEVGVCVLAVRGCASARGRLSTVLVGGRLSRIHAQLAMFMPTPFRMICSFSEFLMWCLFRNVGCCCCLVPGWLCVFVAICRDTVSVRWLPSGCESATLLFACVWKSWFVYFRLYRGFGCCRHVSNAYGWILSDCLKWFCRAHFCDGVIVSEA